MPLDQALGRFPVLAEHIDVDVARREWQAPTLMLRQAVEELRSAGTFDTDIAELSPAT
eukprot:gene7206-9476_t